MAIVGSISGNLSNRSEVGWRSRVSSALQIVTTVSSFVFLFALVVGLI